MKKIIVILALAMAIMSLQSCGSFSNMSYEDAYRNGYNMGVVLGGGSSDDLIKR